MTLINAHACHSTSLAFLHRLTRRLSACPSDLIIWVIIFYFQYFLLLRLLFDILGRFFFWYLGLVSCIRLDGLVNRKYVTD